MAVEQLLILNCPLPSKPTRNIEVAMEILAEERILIAYVEAGTNRELRVVFQTDSGESQITDSEV